MRCVGIANCSKTDVGELGVCHHLYLNGNCELSEDSPRVGADRAPISEKERFDLIPPEFLMKLACLYRDNTKEHPARNWEKGMSILYCYRAAMTHMIKGILGQTDEDHFMRAIWNLIAIVTFLDRIAKGKLDKEFDDRNEIKN